MNLLKKTTLLVLLWFCLFQPSTQAQTQFAASFPNGGGLVTGGMAQLSDGNFLIGFEDLPGNKGVMKVSLSGNIIWRMNLGLAPAKIFELADQSFIMAGSTTLFNPNAELFLLSMSPAGTVNWFKRYQYPNATYLSDFEVTPTGCFVLSGNRFSGNSVVLKTDGAGNVLWGRNMNAPGTWINCLAIDPTNKYFIGGTGDGTAPQLGFGVFFDSLGTYSHYFNSTQGCTIEDAIYLEDSTLVAIGSADGYISGPYYPSMMLLFNPYKSRFSSYLNYGNDFNMNLYSIMGDGIGGWYVAGFSSTNFAGPESEYVAHFNPQDSLIWEDFDNLFVPGGYSAYPGQMVTTRDGGVAYPISGQDWALWGWGLGGGQQGEISGMYKYQNATGLCGLSPSGRGLLPTFNFFDGGYTYNPTITTLVPTVLAASLTPAMIGGSSLVTTSCYHCDAPADASFSTSVVGSTVQFTHLGLPGYEYFWDFGDCSTDTVENPTHTYADPGVYQVCLKMRTPCDSQVVCMPINSCNAADFTGNTVACATVANTWVGNPSSTGHQWLLNGSSVGTASSLTLSGLAVGSYTLTHIAQDGTCQDTVVWPLSVVAGNVVAGFNFVYQNHTVTLTSTSSNAGSWTWDFGDGNTGTGAAVSHTYAMGDTFTVCLIAANGCSADTICQVVSCAMPVADFSYSFSGNQATFTNLSTQSTGWIWHFGDGYSSTAQHPTHNYGSGSSFTGSLIALNGCGVDTLTFTLSPPSGGSVSFDRSYGWPGGGPFKDVVELPSGEFMLVSEGSQGALTRLGVDGSVKWIKQIALPTGAIQFSSIALTSDYKLLLTGRRAQQGVVVQADTLGNVIWTKTFNATLSEARIGLEMANGNYAIGGLQSSSQYVYIAILDPLGNVLQTQQYVDPNGPMELWDMKQTSDGGFILGTWSGMLKINPSLGYDWQSTIYHSYSYTQVMEVPGVGYYATLSEPYNLDVGYVVKHNLSGGLVWAREVDFSNGSFLSYLFLNGLGLDSLGNIVVTGSDMDDPGTAFPPNFGGMDVVALVLNPNTGTTVQDMDLGSANYEEPRSLIISSKNEMVIVGSGFSGFRGEMWKLPLSGGSNYLCSRQSGWINSNFPTFLDPIANTTSAIALPNTAVTPIVTAVAPTALDSCMSYCTPPFVGLNYVRNGMDVQFVTTGGLASFNFGDGGTATNQFNVTHTYASFPVTACATRSNGCGSQTECVNLTGPTCGTASFTGMSYNHCMGTSVTVNSSATGTIVSQTWLLDGVVVGTGSSHTLTHSVAGTHKLQLAVQFSSCVDTAGYLFRVLNTEPLDLGPDFALCPGDTVILSSGQGQLQLQWNGSQIASHYFVSSPGTITAFSSQTVGGGNCQYRDTVVVTAGTPAPPISLGPDLSFCNTFCETLEATAGFDSYVWSGGISNTRFMQVSDSGDYIVEGLHAGGCWSRDTVHVSVSGNAIPTITGPSQICNGTPIVLGTSQPYSTYLWSDGSTNPTLTVTTPGTYTVSVTQGNCSGADTLVVASGSGLIPNLGPDQAFCPGSSVNLAPSGGFSSFVWSNGSTASSVSANAGGIWWVETVDTNGCSARDSILLTQLPSPVVNLGPDVSACPGNSVSLNAGGGFTGYAWSSGQSTQTISVATPGIYSVTVTDGSGCQDADTLLFSALPQPVVNLGPDAGICPGNSVVLNAGGGFASYAWSTGQFTSSISVSVAGTYMVTVTNGVGCQNTDTLVVSLLPEPVVNLGPDAGICPGNSVVLNAGAGFASYAWSTGQSTASISVSTAGTYTVTVTNGAGCQGTDALVVSLLPEPVVNLGPDMDICPGNSVVLNAGAGFASYAWSTGQSTASISVSNAGTYTVTVTNGVGCQGTDALVVTSVAAPAVNLGPDTTVCPGDVVSLQAGSGFASYAWSTGASGNALSVSTPGIYAVTVTNSAGCMGTDSVEVVAGPAAPQAQFSFTQTGNTFAFTDLSAGTVTGWAWDFGDGSTLSLQHPTHMYFVPGTYTVCLVATNDCGADTLCQSVLITAIDDPTASFRVEVFPNPATAAFTVQFEMAQPAATTLQVVNGVGQIVWVKDLGTVSEGDEWVPASQWPAGVYQVRIHHGDSRVVKGIVLQR